MVDILRRSSEKPVAVPAFRQLFYIDGSLGDTETRAAASDLYARFEELYGEAASVTSLNFGPYNGHLRHAREDELEDAREWLASDEPVGREQGVRRYGRLFEDEVDPSIPFATLENGVRMAKFEFDIPVDDANALAFANDVHAVMKSLPTIWGVQGHGFFQPPFLDSLKGDLPIATPRYRTAIELGLHMGEAGVRTHRTGHRWQAGEEPGIPDIGWRTFIGREFWDRIPDIDADLAEVDGVRVERSETVLTITIGDAPIWGDVNADEDISAYRAVAGALEPIAYPLSAARSFAFGGGKYDLPQAEKIERYFRRFTSE